ncbi:MAG: dTDP-4-dehydrorhamnose 3,5-epimerase [Azonexus sp.]|jgi:dTDP-4-dehydrorhamnose 3,5-epimerase|nr:dTDP-4-dehydrorhamnose 3,5-epimerase [Azonexus sp.]
MILVTGGAYREWVGKHYGAPAEASSSRAPGYIRRRSLTCGEWVAETLSSDDKKQFWIPPGFAHGFLTLSETVEFLHKMTDDYAPELEQCIRRDDLTSAIQWPSCAPTLSAKNQHGHSLTESEQAKP